MRALAILKCIGKGVLQFGARQMGLGVGEFAADVAEAAWNEWNKEKAAGERRAELQAIVAMAGEEYRRQVEAVVKELAVGRPAEEREHLSACLEQVPELARSVFRRREDQTGQSVPPEYSIVKASDLIPFVSFHEAGVARGEDDARGGPRVAIVYQEGHQDGTQQVLAEPAVLVFGRGENCNPQIAQPRRRVSRHHCLLEVVLPEVRLRDLGSLNGTFVNGELLGKRPHGKPPEPGFASEDRDLRDGDEVRLADQVVFKVQIEVPPADLGAPSVKTCAWCHREVPTEARNRPGMFVCGHCRGNMREIMQELLGESKSGRAELKAIRDYAILQELGHGGMGAVYLARHEKTGQPAAIKLMLANVAASDWAVDRFQKEVRNTMALRHRHVVRFLDHGYTRGTFFMVLEFCDGGSVADLMKSRGGPLSVDEAGAIILQALDGLDYAHKADLPFVKQKDGGFGPGQGVVHRDVKPANLFLSGLGGNRITKVGDFGIAKAMDDAGLSGGTRTGQRAGTWQFMCRQQVVDFKRAKAEVDVWAVAASLYFMLTGHVPRDFPKGQDPWWTILEKDAVPIRQRNPKIPGRLAQVIDHALREEPEIPFQSAADLKKALEAVL